MRVVVVHNFYRSANASGENLSVSDEIEGLRRRGWDVEVLIADSDAIAEGPRAMADVALRPIYSKRSVDRLERSIARFRPHVALVENVFPLHSPAVITTLKKAGVPVAAGVRSYRMWCVRSSLYRDDHECRECEGTLLNLPAIRHGCYQDRPVASVPMAIGLAVHRPTWRHVDRFLAVSEHVRNELLRLGIGAERITVRPNYVSDPGVPAHAGSGFLYAGRLTSDKGIEILLDGWRRSEIWRRPEHRLRVAGSGPLLDLVRSVPAEMQVDALGLVPHDDMLTLTADTAVTVIPSRWHEPFGRGVVEAASLARPALVTDRGGLPDLVVDGETGWVAAADGESIAAALRLAADPEAQRRYGVAARRRYEQRYTETASLDVLESTLHELIQTR